MSLSSWILRPAICRLEARSGLWASHSRATGVLIMDERITISFCTNASGVRSAGAAPEAR